MKLQRFYFNSKISGINLTFIRWFFSQLFHFYTWPYCTCVGVYFLPSISEIKYNKMKFCECLSSYNTLRFTYRKKVKILWNKVLLRAFFRFTHTNTWGEASLERRRRTEKKMLLVVQVMHSGFRLVVVEKKVVHYCLLQFWQQLTIQSITKLWMYKFECLLNDKNTNNNNNNGIKQQTTTNFEQVNSPIIFFLIKSIYKRIY